LKTIFFYIEKTVLVVNLEVVARARDVTEPEGVDGALVLGRRAPPFLHVRQQQQAPRIQRPD
jgi:hypothetical protein